LAVDGQSRYRNQKLKADRKDRADGSYMGGTALSGRASMARTKKKAQQVKQGTAKVRWGDKRTREGKERCGGGRRSVVGGVLEAGWRHDKGSRDGRASTSPRLSHTQVEIFLCLGATRPNSTAVEPRDKLGKSVERVVVDE
jgi:hypothetical protein